MDEVLGLIMRDAAFYQSSGGGVTFSGGEAMLQIDFLSALLRECRIHALHSAIDTAGAVPWNYFERVLPDTDLFLYDIKAANEEKYSLGTGIKSPLVFENLHRLCHAGARVRIRVPIIPGYNDTVDEIGSIGKLLSEVGELEGIELLRFHKMGGPKYASLGQVYRAENLQSPTDEHMDTLRGVLQVYVNQIVEIG